MAAQLPLGERIVEAEYFKRVFEDPAVTLSTLALAFAVLYAARVLHSIPALVAIGNDKRDREKRRQERLSARQKRLKTTEHGVVDSSEGGSVGGAGGTASSEEVKALIPDAKDAFAPVVAAADGDGGGEGAGEAKGEATVTATVSVEQDVAGVPVKERGGLASRLSSHVTANADESQLYTVASQVSYFGLAAGMMIMMTGPRTPWSGADESVGTTILDLVIWSLLGALMMLISWFVNGFGILFGMSNAREIAGGNASVAVVEASAFIAAGTIIRSCVSGESGASVGVDFASSAVWFMVGQLVLIISVAIMQVITAYDDQKSIKKGNVAAGLRLGGIILTAGILVAHPISITESASAFGSFVGIGLILQQLMRVALDKFLLPMGARSLDEEVEEDANWGVVLVVETACISAAVAMKGLMQLPEGGCALPDVIIQPGA